MQITAYHLNAFTNKQFSGNPAMVCILENWLPDKTLQTIAWENSLPATAFLVRENGVFHTRWFAPEYEIDLCGHGSLASAHVIFNILEPHLKMTKMHSPAGKLLIQNVDGLLTLNFPAKQLEKIDHSELLINGLRAKPKEIYQHKTERCVAVFESEDEVKQISPDLELLRQLDHRGIIATAPSKQFDFVSRTFYPRKTAYEDAVTGSSHCLLIPFWSHKLNKTKLHAYQASHRGGELFCENMNEKVLISGKAVMYMQGMININ